MQLFFICWLCILQLCWISLLVVIICLLACLRMCMCGGCRDFYRDDYAIYKQREFYYLFFIWITFITFSCLTVLTITSTNLLSRNGKSGHLIVPDLRRQAFGFLPLSMMLALCLSYVAFIMLICFLYTHFLRVFIMKECWTFSSMHQWR